MFILKGNNYAYIKTNYIIFAMVAEINIAPVVEVFSALVF